ncbi:GNAT family N-acetyltransferase [Nakamurella sp. PAMC28650]|uniref:GNAT family N-acetyltransferase n=1 Tax=Nakamurella sp. PAMC28650 TaxID=2762325 RepID=UPI00164D3DBC|nr:GNAT family N-acetyltransferase [Nakamurella sp. PAMC28650]
MIGSAGLHRRVGPSGLEIGYWVDRDHLRQGVATATARALTDLAFTVDGIDSVQISHDATNLASAGVPFQLGYDRLPNHPSIAQPGTAGSGVEGVWLVRRDQWSNCPARRG